MGGLGVVTDVEYPPSLCPVRLCRSVAEVEEKSAVSIMRARRNSTVDLVILIPHSAVSSLV